MSAAQQATEMHLQAKKLPPKKTRQPRRREEGGVEGAEASSEEIRREPFCDLLRYFSDLKCKCLTER